MKTRLVVGFAVFGLACCASYATQRVVDAQQDVPAVAIFAQAHIPYFWRVGMAALHGAAAGLMAGFGFPPGVGLRFAAALPWVVLGVVLPSVVAMAVFP